MGCASMLSHFSCIRLFETPWTVAPQAPLSMGVSRQEYWSVLPCLPPGDLPNPEIEHTSLMFPALPGRFFPTSATWEAPNAWVTCLEMLNAGHCIAGYVCACVCVCVCVCVHTNGLSVLPRSFSKQSFSPFARNNELVRMSPNRINSPFLVTQASCFFYDTAITGFQGFLEKMLEQLLQIL